MIGQGVILSGLASLGRAASVAIPEHQAAHSQNRHEHDFWLEVTRATGQYFFHLNGPTPELQCYYPNLKTH